MAEHGFAPHMPDVLDRDAERLSQHASGEAADGIADLRALGSAYRAFINENPQLARVMFSRPFSAFEPGDEEQKASAFIRAFGQPPQSLRRAARAGSSSA